MNGNPNEVIATIVLASGVGLVLAGAYLLARGTSIVGAALLVAGVGDLVAWQVLRRVRPR